MIQEKKRLPDHFQNPKGALNLQYYLFGVCAPFFAGSVVISVDEVAFGVEEAVVIVDHSFCALFVVAAFAVPDSLGVLVPAVAALAADTVFVDVVSVDIAVAVFGWIVPRDPALSHDCVIVRVEIVLFSLNLLPAGDAFVFLHEYISIQSFFPACIYVFGWAKDVSESSEMSAIVEGISDIPPG